MDTFSTRGIWTVALLAVFSLFFFNCKRAADKASDKMVESIVEEATGQEVAVDQSGEKVTIKAKDLTALFDASDNTWPEDMPADVPKPAGLKIKASSQNAGPDSNSWTVFFERAGAAALSAYDAELKKAGFRTVLFDLDDGGSVSGEKGKLTVNFMTGDEDSVLSVVKRKS